LEGEILGRKALNVSKIKQNKLICPALVQLRMGISEKM
jgi:hypothetical protein